LAMFEENKEAVYFSSNEDFLDASYVIWDGDISVTYNLLVFEVNKNLLLEKSAGDKNGLVFEISKFLFKKFINLYDGTLRFLEFETAKNIKLSFILVPLTKFEILLIKICQVFV
jgi:hypothetical protein